MNVVALALAAFLIGGGVWALVTDTPIVMKGSRSDWRTQREAISFCLTFGGAVLTGALVDIARTAGWIDRGTALWLLGLPVTLLLVALIAFRPRRRLVTQ
ncbi:hypothetical protein FHX34_10837 [Actinoplanes teichomyceticus]|uniref:Uncharacterized protein n=2 Tax=Actinoplanes teichomyceticus TaxID=1867 RepID=A0A561VCH9_ACTTI|nr:hypothetical protein FHX34_10837 [Actinoplanes teichomyceticus]